MSYFSPLTSELGCSGSSRARGPGRSLIQRTMPPLGRHVSGIVKEKLALIVVCRASRERAAPAVVPGAVGLGAGGMARCAISAGGF